MNYRLKAYVKASKEADSIIVHEKGSNLFYVQPTNDLGFVHETLAEMMCDNIDPMVELEDWATTESNTKVAIFVAEEGYGYPDEECEPSLKDALALADSYR